MPDLRTHCAISKKRTGFDFKELHQWIDSPKDELGPDHRIERHAYNEIEKRYIKEYWENKKGKGWGDKAIVEWLFHIALDNMSTAHKFAIRYYGDKTYNYLKMGITDNEYYYISNERKDDQQLKKIFSQEEKKQKSYDFNFKTSNSNSSNVPSLTFISAIENTGKSTIAINLAFQLMKEGYTVGLIENNYYNPNFFQYFGEPDHWISEGFLDGIPLEECLIEIEMDGTEGKLFVGSVRPDVFPQAEQLTDDDLRETVAEIMDLQEILEDDLNVDFIIFDNHSLYNLTRLCMNSMFVSEKIYVVTDIDSSNLLRSKQMIKYMFEGKQIEKEIHLILNKAPSSLTSENISDFFSDISLESIIKIEYDEKLVLDDLANISENFYRGSHVLREPISPLSSGLIRIMKTFKN